MDDVRIKKARTFLAALDALIDELAVSNPELLLAAKTNYVHRIDKLLAEITTSEVK